MRTCGENHELLEYKNSNQTPAVRALCWDSHTASYKGCQVCRNLHSGTRHKLYISRNLLNQHEYSTHSRQLKSALQEECNAIFRSYITSLSKDDYSVWKATKNWRRQYSMASPHKKVIRKLGKGWSRKSKSLLIILLTPSVNYYEQSILPIMTSRLS